jgi:hypothetical protein
VDVELSGGSVTQSVNITETVPLLQSEASSVSGVVENETIVNMPLLDRRSAQLQRLSGFAVANGTGSSATFALAGGRGNNANYLIDGGTAQNLTLGVPTLEFDPPVESMQEFNVSISNYAAELGRTGVVAADIGASKFDGLNIGIEKRYSNGLLFKANYTWSHMMDNIDSRNELAAYPGTDSFTNYYNQANDWGGSGNDIRHRFVFSAIYELPVGHGRQFNIGNKALDLLAGGWSAGSILELRTGTPLSPVMLTNTTNSFSDGERPNVVGNPNLSSPTISEWFNTAAFAAPPAYVFGDAGRTFGTGPGAISLDSSLLKNFSLTEKIVAQFRVEALNVLNHPNFANPNTQFGAATFGQVTALVAGNQSRILQLGLHIQF